MLNALRNLLLNSVNRIAYTLRDEFITNVAAGSVNGSNAEPGAGTRGVTDTNSKLSITNDTVSVATGGAANWDPNIVLQTGVSRAAGQLAFFDITVSVNRPLLGFLNAATFTTAALGANKQGSFDLNGTGLGITLANGGSLAVGTIALGTNYTCCLVMRATGTFYFLKGGGYTNWTLFYVEATNSGATCYAYIAVIGTTTVFTSNYIRFPATLWVPVPLVSDSFASAFGTTDGLGHVESSGLGAGGNSLTWTHTTYSVSSAKAINTPGLGSDVVVNGAFAADTDWTKGSGWTIAAGVATGTATSADLTAAVAPLTNGTWYQSTFTLGGFSAGTARMVIGAATNPTHAANGTFTETNRATSTALVVRAASSFTGTIDNVIVKALTLADLFASVVLSTPDVFAIVDLVLAAGTQAGIVLNLDSTSSPANFAIAYHDGTNAHLDKCVAGTYTSVINAAATYSSGAKIKVSKIGTAYRLFYNDAAVGAGTISDAGIVNNGLHGLFDTSPTTNTLDNFIAYASGTSNEYAVLSTLNGA